MKKYCFIMLMVLLAAGVAGALSPAQELMVGHWKGNLGILSKYNSMEFKTDGTVHSNWKVVARWRIVDPNVPRVELAYEQSPYKGKKEVFRIDFNGLKQGGDDFHHYATKKFDETKITHNTPSAVFTGYWIPRHENGKNARKVPFINGKKHGWGYWYYPSGNLQYRTQWNAGVPVNEVELYDTAGEKRKVTRAWKDGKLNGWEMFWDQSGRWTKKVQWDMGKKVKEITP